MNFEDLDILFLTKDIPDYLHDAVYLGLTQLGCNVVDFPRKCSLHGRPHPSEFHSEQLLFNLPENSLRKRPDLMIVTALSHDYNPWGKGMWMNIVAQVEDFFKPLKTVALDGSDKQEIELPVLQTEYCCVLKREMFEKPSSSYYNIDFAPILEPFVYRYYENRDLDFSYMVSPSCQERGQHAEFLSEISEKHGLKSVVFCGAPTRPREEYLDVLSRSRCAVSVRGMGWSCYRYYEIPAKGTVMVAQDTKLDVPDDFDDTQCFKFKDYDELENAILKVRNMSTAELTDMAARAMDHIIKYHTPRKRALYFLSKVFGPKVYE